MHNLDVSNKGTKKEYRMPPKGINNILPILRAAGIAMDKYILQAMLTTAFTQWLNLCADQVPKMAVVSG